MKLDYELPGWVIEINTLIDEVKEEMKNNFHRSTGRKKENESHAKQRNEENSIY